MGVTVFMTVLVGLAALALAAYFIGIYNQMIQVKVNVDKSWSNIEVLEKQRYDEIPKLVTVCEGYMKYERETLEKITRARTAFLEAKTPGDVAKANGQLAGALKSLFAVSENYPELKAKYSVARLGIFGSYVRNEQREESDLDLLGQAPVRSPLDDLRLGRDLGTGLHGLAAPLLHHGFGGQRQRVLRTGDDADFYPDGGEAI